MKIAFCKTKDDIPEGFDFIQLETNEVYANIDGAYEPLKAITETIKDEEGVKQVVTIGHNFNYPIPLLDSAFLTGEEPKKKGYVKRWIDGRIQDFFFHDPKNYPEVEVFGFGKL